MEIMHSANARLALRYLKFASDRELEGFRTVCAPDVVLHFPFHPRGSVAHLGVDEMIKQFSAKRVFETFELQADRVLDCPTAIVIEGRSKGTYKSGRPDYVNQYIFIVECAEGKIQRWTEYYNPLEVLKQK